MLTIELKADEMKASLAVMEHFFSNMAPFMQQVGEYLLTSTKDRIAKGGPAPDGSAWAPKAQSTLARYRAKGEGVDSRPLIHMGKLVGTSLHNSSGADWAELSSSAVYAAIQQFGAAKGSSGSYSGTDKNGRHYSGSAPWGDIPARPFMGISSHDEANIQDIFRENIIALIGNHFT